MPRAQLLACGGEDPAALVVSDLEPEPRIVKLMGRFDDRVDAQRVALAHSLDPCTASVLEPQIDDPSGATLGGGELFRRHRRRHAMLEIQLDVAPRDLGRLADALDPASLEQHRPVA